MISYGQSCKPKIRKLIVIKIIDYDTIILPESLAGDV